MKTTKKTKVLDFIKHEATRLNKVWYYCSADDIGRRLKIPRATVSRYLREMERDRLILSDVRNKKRYDKTKCYQVLNWTPWMSCALDYDGEKALKKYQDTHKPPR